MAEASPAIVLVHDWYGVLQHVEALAARLHASTGFDVTVVDLYGGASATTPEDAEKLMGAMDDEGALARLTVAIDNRRTDDGAPRVGVVGFSMGGFFASVAAALVPVDALVLFYATALGEGTHCPVQAHFAAVDEFPPGQTPGALVDRLVGGNVDTEAFVYRGTEHSFANADVAAYDGHAAALAEARSATAFLRAHLRP